MSSVEHTISEAFFLRRTNMQHEWGSGSTTT